MTGRQDQATTGESQSQAIHPAEPLFGITVESFVIGQAKKLVLSLTFEDDAARAGDFLLAAHFAAIADRAAADAWWALTGRAHG